MNTPEKKSHRTFLWLPAVLLAGLVARGWFGTLGHNYDFDSYRIVADLMARGENVYAGTDRYNYGPVWFIVIRVLDLLAGRNPDIFHWLLIGLLSAADVGIFFVLRRKFGPLAATLFFLNPVSIMITGYHNQFDNVAILFGFCAVILFGDDFEKPLGRRQFLGLAVLGFSLMTKHIFFAFPFWLAVKQRGLFQKLLIIVIPSTIFFAGFLPFWSAGHAGIVQNVFEYNSAPGLFGYNGFFYNQFLPEILKFIAGAKVYWLLCLIFFAFACRTRNGPESLLIYTGVLVAASPAMTNQYLAIPVALVSVAVNPFSICYTLFASAHIAVFARGPQLFHYTGRFDDIAITFLILTLVWRLWRQPLVRGLQICRQEIYRQLGFRE